MVSVDVTYRSSEGAASGRPYEENTTASTIGTREAARMGSLDLTLRSSDGRSEPRPYEENATTRIIVGALWRGYGCFWRITISPSATCWSFSQTLYL